MKAPMSEHGASERPRKTMLLTGASRGIGHATVKLFYQNGWRVLTVSRAAFGPECPWPGGREDHIQADLADPTCFSATAEGVRKRLAGTGLAAIVHNAAVSPKRAGGVRMGVADTS